MSNNSENWMTTFFYQQDLRSKYMNGILNGGLHPGIYNANLSLYTTVAAEATGASTIEMYIKKGTTFIFSNCYKNKNADIEGADDSLILERDLNDTGTVLIKCIALKDMHVSIAAWAKNSATPDKSDAIQTNLLSTERKRTHYVMARLDYNPDAAVESREPEFFICDKNYAYENPDPKKDNYYYLPLDYSRDDMEAAALGMHGIPDGSNNFGRKTRNGADNTSWLCCGILEEKRDIGIENIDYTPWGEPQREGWLQNHVFTGRGLEEYRYNLGASKKSEAPDFFLKNTGTADGLYLDLKQIRAGNFIVSKETDFKKLHKIGKYDSEGITPDYTFNIKDSGKIPAEAEGTIIDAVFLALKTDLTSDIQNISYESKLTNLFNSNDHTPYEIVSLQFLTKLPESANTAPAFDSMADCDYYFKRKTGDAIESELPIPHKGYQSSPRYNDHTLAGKYILPLDVSQANFERLLNIVNNNNIIPTIISYMRKEGLIDTTINSVVPICLAFRTKKKYGETSKYIDLYSTDTSINFANVLSFFDMASKTTAINSVPVEVDDIYTVLPII